MHEADGSNTKFRAHFSAAKTRSTVALIRARGVAAPDVAGHWPAARLAGTPGLGRSGQGGQSWRPGRLLPYAAREVVGIEQGFELAGVTVAARGCGSRCFLKPPTRSGLHATRPDFCNGTIRGLSKGRRLVRRERWTPSLHSPKSITQKRPIGGQRYEAVRQLAARTGSAADDRLFAPVPHACMSAF